MLRRMEEGYMQNLSPAIFLFWCSVLASWSNSCFLMKFHLAQIKQLADSNTYCTVVIQALAMLLRKK